MLKLIKKNHRKAKNFLSAYIASLLVSFIIGVYFTILLNSPEKPDWNKNPFTWIILTTILILILIFYYIFGMKNAFDFRDKQNFYDNYFMSIAISVFTTLLISYNYFFKIAYNAVYVLLALVIFYFPLNYLYIKLRPKDKLIK